MFEVCYIYQKQLKDWIVIKTAIKTMLPDSDDFNFGLEVSDFVVSCIGGGFLGGYMLYNNININYILQLLSSLVLLPIYMQ